MDPAIAQFLQHLAHLETLVGHPDGRLRQEVYLTLNHLAQDSLLQMPSPDHGPNLVPHQTEISRTLRLIGIDISFLQAARQPQTRQQRQHHLRDRLQRLRQHTEALQELLQSPPIPDKEAEEQGKREPVEGSSPPIP